MLWYIFIRSRSWSYDVCTRYIYFAIGPKNERKRTNICNVITNIIISENYLFYLFALTDEWSNTENCLFLIQCSFQFYRLVSFSHSPTLPYHFLFFFFQMQTKHFHTDFGQEKCKRSGREHLQLHQTEIHIHQQNNKHTYTHTLMSV